MAWSVIQREKMIRFRLVCISCDRLSGWSSTDGSVARIFRIKMDSGDIIDLTFVIIFMDHDDEGHGPSRLKKKIYSVSV